MPRESLLRLLKHRGIVPDFATHPLYIVGVRGYYLDTMGEKGKNDRGLYDDALFLLTRDEFHPFNGNTDPSRHRPGRKSGPKGMPQLRPGLWLAYKFDDHRPENRPAYPAICQRGRDVTVVRDGIEIDYIDHGRFGINIHRGGKTTTSSIGCQTVPPEQWDDFYTTAVRLAKGFFGGDYQNVYLPYALVENTPETNG